MEMSWTHLYAVLPRDHSVRLGRGGGLHDNSLAPFAFTRLKRNCPCKVRAESGHGERRWKAEWQGFDGRWRGLM